MERGIVKWFDEEKGYGFISSTIDGKDYFIHKTNIEDLSLTLDKGQQVEFEIVEGKKGKEAAKVKLITETT